MAEGSDKADVRIARNFRLPADTIKMIGELQGFFNESQADVISRAISFLNDNRKLAIEQESAQRINKLSSK